MHQLRSQITRRSPHLAAVVELLFRNRLLSGTLPTMWDASVLIVFAAGCWFWFDSMQAREHALAAGPSACMRNGLQFLDETVECVSIRPARSEAGHMVLRRVYRFEFSDDGHSRRSGSIVMLGGRLESITMEPFLMH